LSRWDSFEKYCIQLTPVLESISHNGLGIDPDAQKAFFDTLTKERDAIYEVIQQKIPLHVFKVKSWKRSPKIVDAEGYATITIGKKDDEKITARVKLIAYPEGGFWARLPFNPRSWEMVQDLAVALGAKLPKKQDSDDPDDTATDDKALKKVAKKFPVFEDIRQYRKRDKLINSYSWSLDEHNRVHPVFGYHPSTWRKSCRQPNVQTIPKRSDLAKAFRKMIVPRAGNVLIEGDSAAIEAVIVGWLAGSERYIRLARAGVHGWITSALHGMPISLDISDAALTAACQAAKKEWPDDYEKCKRIVHLSSYCGTPRRIAEEYPEEFPKESDAAKLQNFFFSTEAGQDIKRWQKQTIEIAHANKGLENHFGLRHRFYSLYSYDSRRQSYVLGDDAKRAVAFVPQSDASFVQSDTLLRLVARDARYLGWIVAIIHDSIILDCPASDSDYAAGVLYEEMIRALPQLDNLWIGSEIKIGSNLSEMTTWKAA
jgi:DNA polymerase family A